MDIRPLPHDFLFCFCLSAQRAVMTMIIIPLHHNTPPPPTHQLFHAGLAGLSWLAAAVTRHFAPPPPQANTLAPPLLVCAVYDVSHLLPQPQPQPHPTTFNPTLSHNMYCHVTTNIQQHHNQYTIPHHTRAPLHKTFCRSFLRQKSGNSGKKKKFHCNLHRDLPEFFYGKKKSGKKFYATGPR